MKILIRRRIPFPGMALATLLGVAGGIYIYKPMFKPVKKTNSTIDEDDAIVVDSAGKLDRGTTK